MDERALIALQAGLGPGQLERLAAFAGHQGALLLAPGQGAIAFTLAIATAMRLARPESDEP